MAGRSSQQFASADTLAPDTRYRQLIDNLPVGVYRATVEGRFVELNPAALRLLGFDSLEAALAYPVPDLYVDPADRQHLLDELKEKGHLTAWRVRQRRPDGSTFWLELHATLVRDDKGRPCFIDGILQDVTHYVEAEKLRGAALALTSTLERNRVVERIMAHLQEVVPYDSVSVQLLQGDRLEIVGGRGFPDFEIFRGLLLPDDVDTPNAEVLRRRSTFIVDDVWARYESFRREPHSLIGTRGWMGVPMCVGERLIGMIALDKREPGFYTEAHARQAEAFAAQAAIAFENSRLFEEAQRRADELARLHEAAVALSSTLDMAEVLRAVAYQVGQALNVSSAYICSWDEEALTSTVLAEWISPDAPPRERESDLGTIYDMRDFPTTCQALRRKETLAMRVSDPNLDPADLITAEQYGLRASLIVPLLVRDEVIGYIELWETRYERVFSEAEVRLCQTLAADAATALERARLYDEAVHRSRDLSTLLEAANALASKLDLSWVLQVLGDRLLRITSADGCVISKWDREENKVIPIWQVGEVAACPLTIFSVVGRAEMTEVLLLQQPSLLLDGDEQVAAEIQRQMKEQSVCSVLLLPMVARGQTVGLIELGRQAEAFAREDIDLAQTLASQAAVAMDNARLYEEIRCLNEELERRVRQRTAQIEAQYARLEAVLRSTSDGIIVTDSAGDIFQANPIVESWLSQTLPPEDATRLRRTVRDLALRAEERPEEVLELKGLDLQLNAAPIADAGPDGARAVVAVHDVSYLKALDRLKSRLVSNVSHELRTPITAIKLYASLMRRSPPDRWGEYLAALEQEAERQARLIEDILQLSRIDAGRLETKPEALALDALTAETVASHQVMAQQQGVALRYTPAPSALMIWADRGQILQVLTNLLTNAIRYTEPGGRIEVTAEGRVAGERPWATVTVSDTGIGIPEEELPHIFERFYRGEKPRESQVPGTGLGLPIAKEIVELHGGHIDVRSRVGVGSTFTVWLPLKGESNGRR